MGCSWRRLRARQHDLRRFLRGAVQGGGMADPLHQGRAGLAGQRVDHGVPGLAVLGADLDLDQLVPLQDLVQFGHQGRGDALAADLHQGLEAMGLATEEAVLGGGQDNWHRVRDGLRGGSGYHGRPSRRGRRARPLRMSRSSRSKSSHRWLREHFSDPYVKKAQAEGLRSRAAYKPEEPLERARLLKPGMAVVDLGAAPGGWSQYVRQALGDSGRVIALDILEMPPLAGVEFLHGD